MDYDGVLDVLRLLGCDSIDYSSSNGWVNATCPFAPYTHDSGTDRSPSFGIQVNAGGDSGFNCFACHRSGATMSYMAYLLEVESGRPFDELRDFLRERGEMYQGGPKVQRSSGSFRPKKRRKNVSMKIGDDFKVGMHSVPSIAEQGALEGMSREIERPCLPESMIDRYSPIIEGDGSRAARYMAHRGFGAQALARWGLLDDGNRRVIFPIRDRQGRLLAFSRRTTWDKPVCQNCGYRDPQGTPKHRRTISFGAKPDRDDPDKGGCPSCHSWVWPKYQHSKGFQRNFYLFGEHLFDDSFDTAILVEGQTDAMRLDQLGWANAMATLGSKPGTMWPDHAAGRPGEQMYQLSSMVSRAILVADGDSAGREWANKIQGLFRNAEHLLEVVVIYCPAGTDPGDAPVDFLNEQLMLYSAPRRSELVRQEGGHHG